MLYLNSILFYSISDSLNIHVEILSLAYKESFRIHGWTLKNETENFASTHVDDSHEDI